MAKKKAPNPAKPTDTYTIAIGPELGVVYKNYSNAPISLVDDALVEDLRSAISDALPPGAKFINISISVSNDD